MTYIINNYDGTPLVSIADRTINTSATSLKLPSRDFPRYGEPVVEDLVWMLQHFAAPNAPLNPVAGQIWYNSNTQAILVHNGSTWLGTGKTQVGSVFPVSADPGQVFYHTAKRQAFIRDSAAIDGWKLIGPMGAYDGSDRTPVSNNALPVSGFTNVESAIVLDTSSTEHRILRITVGTNLVAIISSDAFTYNITGFTNINPGINLNTTIGNNKYNGTASAATLAADSTNLGGVASTSYMRRDQSNLPTVNNSLDLGSSSFKYANVHATLFQGTATSARYADVAERYHAGCPIPAGTVVSLGGDAEIVPSTVAGCTHVLGVISTNPALAMNNDAGDDQTHPLVALVGRVPVWVQGPVCKGERLMASAAPGVAEAWDPSAGVFAVLGRSLVTKISTGTELVEAVVGKF